MPTVAELAADQRIIVPYPAIVLDNADPRGLHRVRLRVPGLIDATGWAYPLTNGGGSARRGDHIVPHAGAVVVVQFLGGDPEHPVYSGGWWGIPDPNQPQASEVPDIARAAGEDAHLVSVRQTGRMLIVHDDRERDEAAGTGQIWSVTDVVTGDEITFDLVGAGITIKASSELNLLADGVVNITAGQVVINGRRVNDTTGRQI